MGAQVGVDIIVDWDTQVFGKLVFKAVGMMIPKRKYFSYKLA